MKFEVGDKAIVLEAQYSFEKVGYIITVTDVEDFYVMRIHQDNHGWSWGIERIEKLEEPTRERNLEESTPVEVKTEGLSTKKDIMLTDDASEHLSKILIDDLNAENAKLKKQIKLLHIMLQGRGYEALAIASALELLD